MNDRVQKLAPWVGALALAALTFAVGWHWSHPAPAKPPEQPVATKLPDIKPGTRVTLLWPAVGAQELQIVEVFEEATIISLKPDSIAIMMPCKKGPVEIPPATSKPPAPPPEKIINVPPKIIEEPRVKLPIVQKQEPPKPPAPKPQPPKKFVVIMVYDPEQPNPQVLAIIHDRQLKAQLEEAGHTVLPPYKKGALELVDAGLAEYANTCPQLLLLTQDTPRIVGLSATLPLTREGVIMAVREAGGGKEGKTHYEYPDVPIASDGVTTAP